MPRKTDPKNLERVLDAAAELFLAEGYDAATMQQLADKLGLAQVQPLSLRGRQGRPTAATHGPGSG